MLSEKIFFLRNKFQYNSNNQGKKRGEFNTIFDLYLFNLVNNWKCVFCLCFCNYSYLLIIIRKILLKNALIIFQLYI